MDKYFREGFTKTSGEISSIVGAIPQFADDFLIYGSRFKKAKAAKAREEGLAKEAFDEHWVEEGAKVELEHTKDIELARKIAKDHLNEDPDYYKDWKNKEKILFQKRANWLNRVKGTKNAGPLARRLIRNSIRQGRPLNPTNVSEIINRIRPGSEDLLFRAMRGRG